MKELKATDVLAVTRPGTGTAFNTYKVSFPDINQLVHVGPTGPATPRKGALWLHDTNGVLYVFDGKFWVGK